MPRWHCSFCGKADDEVERLIAGPAVFICNECVALSAAALVENPPALVRLGRLLVLVRLPDGSIHGCERESEWQPFEHDGERFEWCTARSNIRRDVPLRVMVAVRRIGHEGPARGMTFSSETIEEHARAIVKGTPEWNADR